LFVVPSQAAAAPGAQKSGACGPSPVSTAVAPGSALADTPSFRDVPGLPFDVVTTRDGRFTFISSDGTHSGSGSVLVYAGDGGSGRLLREVSLRSPPLGMALTDQGHTLLVAVDDGLTLIDVKRAELGGAEAVVAEAHGSGSGGIEVAATPDGRFVFESMEDSGQVDVFRLSGERTPRFAGAVRVGALPVGIASVRTDERRM